MGSMILIIIIVILAANGNYTLLYIAGGLLALSAAVSVFSGGKSQPKESPRAKIHHPRYYEGDEYECGICGARFRRNADACPRCGARFNRTETDWKEFDDEEELDDILFGDD